MLRTNDASSKRELTLSKPSVTDGSKHVCHGSFGEVFFGVGDAKLVDVVLLAPDQQLRNMFAFASLHSKPS